MATEKHLSMRRKLPYRRRMAAIPSERPEDFDRLLANTSHIALVVIGIFTVLVALSYARFFLAPIFLAVVIGLMLVPYARRMEAAGMSSGVSALISVVSLLALLTILGVGLAVPLSDWTERLPLIWARINDLISSWRDMIAISKYQEILSELQLTEENMKVDLGDADTVKEAASKAPALLGQFLIFITSLYFFVATRDEFRASVLKLCFSRALRLRMARIFLDIELKVSRYLVQITLINIGLGVATTIAMWLIGVPSPVLWGVLAGLLNYVIYLGPALMAFILFMVGLSTGGTLFQVALPAMVFLGLNLTEAYFVTPQFLGRALTMNPFIVFLALAFWIWIWGPVGGFVAVPSLLITYTILTHVLGQRVRTPKLPA